MKSVIAIASVILAACATRAVLTPIDYQFVDNPVNKRIELIFANESKHMMCLSPSNWPNAAGKIDQASDIMFLVVGDKKLPVSDFNTGYCPGGCFFRVAPGKTLKGTISYEDFRLPADLVNEPKRLEFSPQAFRCSIVR